jgi:hypothetical protein
MDYPVIWHRANISVQFRLDPILDCSQAQLCGGELYFSEKRTDPHLIIDCIALYLLNYRRHEITIRGYCAFYTTSPLA